MRANLIGTLAAVMMGDSGSFRTPNTAMQQIFSTVAANPNTAAITPTVLSAGAIFYQDPSTGTGTNVWIWSIANQTWIQFSV